MSRALACALLLLLPAAAGAQEQTPAPEPPRAQRPGAAATQEAPRPRPRIGVALEGGGALGLAHIGVLKWFEEHHIPVDYVAGTSMGGLVAGFYAAGESPNEMEQLVAGVDWKAMFGDKTPYEQLSFRRKEDQRAIPNSLLLGLRNGVSLPAGLNAGHQISLLIDRETLAYYDMKSFDDLPVPFRCVATDLITGKPSVFKDGSLGEALRATVSIPGVFTPSKDKDKVYVDGGLVNNLPSDVVRDMGADIVIAVHLERTPPEAKDIHSLFSVLGQSVRVVIAENELRGLARADAVVSVDLKRFESTNYKANKAIVQKGYEGAAAKERLLESFALSEAAWTEYVHERDGRKRTAPGAPEFVKVLGTNPEAERNLEKFLQRLAGKPLDSRRVDDYLTRLTGIGKFDSASYRITRQEGKEGLLVTVHEMGYAPPMIQPAFEMDGSESGDVEFTIGARLTFMDVAGYRSEWRTDFQFGNTYGVHSELYRPFTASSKWFFAPHADASDTAFKFVAKNDPVADFRFYRENIGGDLGYGFNRFSELRAGYQVGYLSTRLRLGAPEIATVKGRVGATRLRYVLDHTDDPVIPRRGFSAETDFSWFDTSPAAAEAFPSLQQRLNYFQPVSKEASIFFEAEGGSTFAFHSTGLPQFYLGGPLRLSAYGQNELFGNQYYLYRGGYLHDLITLPPFVGKKVYAIGSYEFGKMYGAASASKFPNDVAAGVLAETAFGPFFIGGSVGDSGHHKWFFQLGRVF